MGCRESELALDLRRFAWRQSVRRPDPVDDLEQFLLPAILDLQHHPSKIIGGWGGGAVAAPTGKFSLPRAVA